jgi:hypothetical protein
VKWFKHMSTMSEDVKIKRLIRRFGVEGYGLYNYILELIVRRLETDSPLPDLEESSNDIANDLSMDTVRVEEIIWFCVEQGLFEQDEMTGRILASKVYKFLQQSETRSEQIRAMITTYKDTSTPKMIASQMSQTVIDKCEEQNTTEHNTTELESASKPRKPKANTHVSVTEDISVPVNEKHYQRLCKEYGESTVKKYILTAYNYAVSNKGKVTHYRDYAATCENYMTKAGVPKQPKRTEIFDYVGVISGNNS